jgi:hypothetical protein
MGPSIVWLLPVEISLIKKILSIIMDKNLDSNFFKIHFYWIIMVRILSKCARIPPSFAGGMNGLPSPLGERACPVEYVSLLHRVKVRGK